jgi:hypothetical protein
MEKMKNEELTRVVEEERFKGQGYFIDYKGTLMSLDEFKEGHWNKLGQAEKNKFAFVLDLLGHFVCVIIIGNEGFLMDTTHNNYLDT